MANTFYSVQNLNCPEEGSQLIVGNDYTISFYNPYEMYVSDWNPASENVIRLYIYNDGDLTTTALKQQTIVTGQNTFSFNLSDYDLDSERVTDLGVTIKAYISVDDNLYTLYFTSEPKVTFEYGKPIFYTACGAPTACSVSSTLATGNVTLSWSGAKAGTSNAITGYEIQRCESTDGSTWGSWAALTTVSTTATSGSTSVAPPSTAGNYYKYRVRTRGAAGEDYYSEWLESTNILRRDHDALPEFTDSTLTVGASPVKALHMTELQTAVNTLRTFYGLTAYDFTAITAGQTSLAGWTTHVNEIRAAVDEVCTASGKTHETWISFSVNCPRADVLSQLRAVVLSI